MVRGIASVAWMCLAMAGISALSPLCCILGMCGITWGDVDNGQPSIVRPGTNKSDI